MIVNTKYFKFYTVNYAKMGLSRKLNWIHPNAITVGLQELAKQKNADFLLIFLFVKNSPWFDSDFLLWFLETLNFGGVGEKSIQDLDEPGDLQKHKAIPWRG